MEAQTLYDMFETDSKLEAEGVEIRLGKNADKTVRIFIIGAMYKTNPKYMKALEKVTQEYKAQLQTETLTGEQAEEINLQVFVDTVLFGWKNIHDREGKPVMFTKKAAIKLFTDLPRLYDILVNEASKASRFRAAKMEADSGN